MPPPDTRSWPWFFEPLLDEFLAIFCPGWTLPPPPAEKVVSLHAPVMPRALRDRHRRCRSKRARLARALEEAPDDVVAEHATLLLRAVMHDLNPSHNVTLIEPIINAVGHRDVHEAIIGYMETGTDIQRSAATMAWYAAQPAVHYRFIGAGEPTPESAALLATIAGLDARYRDACRRALATCQDPKTRARISASARHPHYLGVRYGL